MKTVRLSILSALVLTLSIASSAWAVDEGQTQPRLNSVWTNNNTTVNLIPLTSGSGNIKGFFCDLYPGGSIPYPDASLHFYVDGGAAQTIDPNLVLTLAEADGTSHSPVMPMNIRFQSSIRVTLQKVSGNGSIQCAVSWGLD
jgi:hypothetical protein